MTQTQLLVLGDALQRHVDYCRSVDLDDTADVALDLIDLLINEETPGERNERRMRERREIAEQVEDDRRMELVREGAAA